MIDTASIPWLATADGVVPTRSARTVVLLIANVVGQNQNTGPNCCDATVYEAGAVCASVNEHMPFVLHDPEMFVAIAYVPVPDGVAADEPVVTRTSQVRVPTLCPVLFCRLTDGQTRGTLTLPFAGSADPMNSIGPYPDVELRGTTK